MELPLSFPSDLKHNHIDHICMVFLLCVFVYVVSILPMFGISFGNICTRNVADRLYRDVLADVESNNSSS